MNRIEIPRSTQPTNCESRRTRKTEWTNNVEIESILKNLLTNKNSESDGFMGLYQAFIEELCS